MNKKFLSAVLFGALMATSTGTFVSCKDYDDDIDRIDNTLNDLKSQIATLQKLVGEGNWVTGITSIENGFTITMSNGQTSTITGINGKDGVDGKNGTEWTIGEDGFWYMDGEKTDHYALGTKGEDGKPGTNGTNGVTAPAPKINADGFWVVYEWDTANNQFVEKVTEVSAQGTSAYVVEKDGVYILHIADETGAFQDVTLPATSDSFVAQALKDAVIVMFETATWEPNTTAAAYKTLLKEFPAIADIKKGDLVKQGGNLPVIISPSSVDLAKGFSFSLQTLKGETPDIAISNPTKGLPANIAEDDNNSIETRSADANACFWTLKVEPALNENKTDYVDTDNKWASLVIENAKGSVVKTAFAYKVEADSKDENDVTVNEYSDENPIAATAEYAGSIDLFAEDANENTPIKLANEYIGYYIIKATDALQVEKYGLEIEGSILKIGNMPADVTSISVNLEVTALGLNGTAKTFKVDLSVNQSLLPAGKLSDQAKVLSLTAQKVRWDIEPLNFSATMLNKLCNATKTITLTREEKGVTYIAYQSTFNCYKADGTEGADYQNIKSIGFDVLASDKVSDKVGEGDEAMIGEQIMPKTYTVTLTAKDGNTKDASVIYTATAKLAMSNPTSVIKLADAFVEDGVLQVVGKVNEDNKVVYDLSNAMVYKSNEVSQVKFEDYTHTAYMEGTASIDETAFGYPNWIDNTGQLSVNTWLANLPTESNQQQLYKERQMRATFILFNNEKNEATFDFPVKVKSAVYSDKPEDVVKVDGTKLTAIYGGVNGKDLINVQAITKAVLAAGPKAGTEYKLFTVKGTTVKKTKTYYNYTKPSTVDGKDNVKFAINGNGVMVEVELNDMAAFGFGATAIANKQQGKENYYIITENSSTTTGEYQNVTTWNTIFGKVDQYYKKVTDKDDSDKSGYCRNEVKVKDEDQAIVILFEKYAAKIAYSEKAVVEEEETVEGSEFDENYLTKASYIEFVNTTEAAKYAEISDNVVVKAKLNAGILDVPNGKINVDMRIVVKDKWGMTMKVPFTVTLKTAE